MFKNKFNVNTVCVCFLSHSIQFFVGFVLVIYCGHLHITHTVIRKCLSYTVDTCILHIQSLEKVIYPKSPVVCSPQPEGICFSYRFTRVKSKKNWLFLDRPWLFLDRPFHILLQWRFLQGTLGNLEDYFDYAVVLCYLIVKIIFSI